jgi:hypothetical protein
MLDVAQVAVQYDPSLSSRGSTLNEMSYNSMKTFITHSTRKDFRRWITLIVQENSLTIEVGKDISDPEAQKLIAEMEDGCVVKELFVAYKTIEYCSDQKFEQLKKIALRELMEMHQRGNKARAEWPGTVQWLDSVNN